MYNAGVGLSLAGALIKNSNQRSDRYAVFLLGIGGGGIFAGALLHGAHLDNKPRGL